IEHPVDFETLLKESDILSLHAPLTEKTKGIINKDTIALMKQ
ncbi:MAG: D-2-hydroxyacid dehydrogenase, partial [Muribaculaceae bacterium]|nr:D-2-hydroxyacid dehydrogenase [Muribaculaceae bacterium]